MTRRLAAARPWLALWLAFAAPTMTLAQAANCTWYADTSLKQQRAQRARQVRLHGLGVELEQAGAPDLVRHARHPTAGKPRPRSASRCWPVASADADRSRSPSCLRHARPGVIGIASLAATVQVSSAGAAGITWAKKGEFETCLESSLDKWLAARAELEVNEDPAAAQLDDAAVATWTLGDARAMPRARGTAGGRFRGPLHEVHGTVAPAHL